MAAKKQETAPVKIYRVCGNCANAGEVTFNTIYLCKILGTRNFDKINCTHFKQKAV